MISLLPTVIIFWSLSYIPEVELTASTNEAIVVDTPSGQIKGVRTIDPGSGTPVYQFRQVPFAKPPVNDLRFRNPVPYGKWEGILDATKFGPSCQQPNTPLLEFLILPNDELSEDCLHLNIYVPRSVSGERKLPVMIWVHGGEYIVGQGMFYPSSSLSAFGDVIVVTINYRLGIFGFFSLKNPAARGNYGMWDQIMAFRWVNENIATFGGDPDSVTIFGESAGGFSVGLQALIPSNKGLFHRVIAQSGTSEDAVLSRNAHIYSREVGESLGCKLSSDEDAEDFMECLREKSATSILDAASSSEFLNQDTFNLTFTLAPVVDGILFPESPSKLLSGSYPDITNFFSSIDMIVGVTSHEGSLLYEIFNLPKLQENSDLNMTRGISTRIVCDVIGRNLMLTLLGDASEEMQAAVCEHYSDRASEDRQSMRAVDLFSEILFVAPAINTVKLHSTGNAKSNTFYYRFSKITTIPFAPVPPWFKGSGHGDELFYLFGDDMVSSLRNKTELTIEDRPFSASVMRYWTNFAKSGSLVGSDVGVRGYLLWEETGVPGENPRVRAGDQPNHLTYYLGRSKDRTLGIIIHEERCEQCPRMGVNKRFFGGGIAFSWIIVVFLRPQSLENSKFFSGPEHFEFSSVN